MGELLVDRYVTRFIDEVYEEIERGGAPTLSDTMDKVLEAIPEYLSRDEREEAEQRAMEAEILRYRAEVEEPAAKIVRARKASSPCKVKKVAVPFSGYDRDAAFYREALDGIEPEVEVAEPPGLASLALRVSWAPDFTMRSHPYSGFVSGFDRNLLVLYVGPYRPFVSLPGFYLVYDAWASTVSVIPALPSRLVNCYSHGGLGTGVAILRYEAPSNYVLAELLLCKEKMLKSNKADLILWWSFGPSTGRWIQKQVKLPLPSEPEEHSSRRTYTFRADTVLAVGDRGLCWFDLLQGFLICEDVSAAHPLFRFISLPEDCVRDGRQGRGQPEEYRSASTIPLGPQGAAGLITFVTMDGRGDRPVSDVTLTVWFCFWEDLILPNNEEPLWEEGPCVSLGELLTNSMYKDALLLQPTMPILSTTGDPIVYLSFVHPKSPDENFEFVDDHSVDTPTKGSCVLKLKLDLELRKVLSAEKLPTGSGVFPNPNNVFASDLNMLRSDAEGECSWPWTEIEETEWQLSEGERLLIKEELMKQKWIGRERAHIADDWGSDEVREGRTRFEPNPWPWPLRGLSAPGRPFPPPPGRPLIHLMGLASLLYC